MIVFDFDQTLCQHHTCRRSPVAPLEYFHPKTAYMLYALQRRGYQLAVASFGNQDVILGLLHKLTPGLFSRANVVTPRHFQGGQDGSKGRAWSKDRMLQLLAQRYHINPHHMLLYDDTLENVRDAFHAGFHAVHVAYDARTHTNNLLPLVYQHVLKHP